MVHAVPEAHEFSDVDAEPKRRLEQHINGTVNPAASTAQSHFRPHQMTGSRVRKSMAEKTLAAAAAAAAADEKQPWLERRKRRLLSLKR